jgi:hypothetical protein
MQRPLTPVLERAGGSNGRRQQHYRTDKVASLVDTQGLGDVKDETQLFEGESTFI